MNSWTAKDMPDQSGRVVIITGANSGVGYESAIAFARKGARVVMACRSMDKGERARQDLLKRVPNADIDLQQLDLGSLKSIHSFAESFNTRYDRLDILMNNAGIMVPPYGKTADGFETQFGTNHLGHFAFTGLLLPKVLATPRSRIVTVSSSAAYQGRINFDDLQSEKVYRPWAGYSQSKLANILFAEELQRKLAAMNSETISVVSHPGYAVTNLQSTVTGAMQRFFSLFLTPVMSQNAELGATYQLYAATAPDVHGGEFFGPQFVLRGSVVRAWLNAQAQDTAVAARLWQVSEQLIGMRYEFAQPVAAR